MDKGIFKAYDIRGIYPDEIDEDAAYRVGRAFTRFLSAKTVVVGRDARESSPALAEKLIEGISCEGADVINIGLCTTPMLNFAVANYDYDGGIMISASHNPKEYNAFKLIKSGPLQIDEESGIKEIQNIAEKGFTECPGKGAVTEKDVLSDYVAHILKFAEGISELKIVVDYSNGVGSISAKPVFARLDIDVIELFSDPDGNFPNHPANPHDTENFKDLIKKVLKEEADLGIFFDGDADRAIFVDEKGQIVPTDLLVIYLCEEALKKNEEKNACPPPPRSRVNSAERRRVYYDLRFSKAVPGAVKKFGGTPEMLRVGNSFYKKALLEKGGVLAAEFSGHIMYAENFNIDDGLFAAIKVMQMLCEERKKLSELTRKVQKYEDSPEISLEAKTPETTLDRIVAEFPGGKLNELDGVYLDFPDGFISVRQSQTETQLFRIRIEAKTKGVLNDRLEKVKKIITEG